MQSVEKQKTLRKRKQSLKMAELLLEGSHGAGPKNPSHSHTPSSEALSPPGLQPSSPSSSSSSSSASSWTSGSEGEEDEEEVVGGARLVAPPHGEEEGDGKGEWGSPNSNSSD